MGVQVGERKRRGGGREERGWKGGRRVGVPQQGPFPSSWVRY